MAEIPLDASQAYQRLGVSPVINAAGSVTKYGGTRTRPEVLEVMAGAARIMVNVEELNRKAGEDIARLTGCLLYTSPSPRDLSTSRMPSSA